MPSQALQIAFVMQSQRNSPKKSSKENTFFQIANHLFLHFDPAYFIDA
jgi:hypothetical protein